MIYFCFYTDYNFSSVHIVRVDGIFGRCFYVFASYCMMFTGRKKQMKNQQDGTFFVEQYIYICVCVLLLRFFFKSAIPL